MSALLQIFQIHVCFIEYDIDAVVSFQRDAYFTTEDSGSVEICVNTSTVLRDTIVVRYVHLFRISLLTGVLLCFYLFYFIKEKSSFTCNVSVDFTHITHENLHFQYGDRKFSCVMCVKSTETLQVKLDFSFMK